MRIRHSMPVIGPEEKKAVLEVLDSGMLAAGPKVREFERMFARYLGMSNAVAVTNATAGLNATLMALGIGPGDLVITTPLTFIASANAILHCGARPIFADVDPDTLNLSGASVQEVLARTSGVKAILAVHLYGLPCDMDSMVRIASQHGLILVEDCAQAHGARIGGRFAGTFGDAAVFSFYATKNMTTGEGGLVVTNSSALAEKVRSIANHGRVGRYLHDIVGYNYRMTDIAAALGIAQLKRLDALNEARQNNALRYTEAFRGLEGITTPCEPPGFHHVYHQYVVRTRTRDVLASWLEDRGIETAVVYPRILPDQPAYRSLSLSANCPHASAAASEVLSLPVHPSLTSSEVEEVIRAVIAFAHHETAGLPECAENR